jgi:hypothetical protein
MAASRQRKISPSLPPAALWHRYSTVKCRYLPVPELDPELFSKWFGRHKNRLLRRSRITNDIYVSTVFLGIDHNLSGLGFPVLWETMIFGGPQDGFQRRYSSRAAALKGHALAVALTKRGLSHISTISRRKR